MSVGAPRRAQAGHGRVRRRGAVRAAALAVLLAGCATGGSEGGGQDTDASVVEACEACGGDCVTTYTPNVSRQHVTDDVEYASEPPSSGDHNPCWAAWGDHAEQVPAENWVHNLEHGAVVFLWDCPDGCEEELTELRAYVATLPEGRTLTSPYEPASTRFTVLAWEHRLELECLDLATIAAFYEAHVGHAPEDTPADPSAECM